MKVLVRADDAAVPGVADLEDEDLEDEDQALAAHHQPVLLQRRHLHKARLRHKDQDLHQQVDVAVVAWVAWARMRHSKQ